jgi:hypothetical protein
MKNIKDDILKLLLESTITVYSKGSCGELGDSFNAVDSDDFNTISNKIVGIVSKKIDEIFINMIDVTECKTVYEAYLTQQINLLKETPHP